MFFSDICNFSGISNRLTAEEMLGWIGYVFFVMDHVADHFYVHKIKTIGDAYFAISGLPGLGPSAGSSGAEAEGSREPAGSASLRMLQFASVCAQVFSGKYLHPEAGQCLQAIAATSAVLRKEQRRAMAAQRRRSGASSAQLSSARGSQAAGESVPASGKCAMRYGVACGPVTVGVLQGKCPAFDVWGKTVNLASRMEVSALCSFAFFQWDQRSLQVVCACPFWDFFLRAAASPR